MDVTGIQTAKDYTDMVQALSGHTKDLAEIAEAVKLMNKFGKAAAVMGMVSVGLDLAMTLSGAPSPEDQILDAVEELSGKVTDLWHRLDQGLEEQKLHVTMTDAKAGVAGELSNIRTLGDTVNEYQRAVRENDADLMVNSENELTSIGSFNIKSWLNALQDQAIGTEFRSNVFIALYESTNGDLDSVRKAGLALTSSAATAVLAVSMIEGIEWKTRHGKDVLPEEERKKIAERIEREMGPAIDAISSVFATYIEKCTTEASQNIEAKLVAIMPTIDMSSYLRAVKAINSKIEPQWSWLDFVTIAFGPCSTGREYAFCGPSTKEFLYATGKGGVQRNIVVHWVEKHQPNALDLWQQRQLVKALAERDENPDHLIGAALNAEQAITFEAGDKQVQAPHNPKIARQAFLLALRSTHGYGCCARDWKRLYIIDTRSRAIDPQSQSDKFYTAPPWRETQTLGTGRNVTFFFG